MTTYINTASGAQSLGLNTDTGSYCKDTTARLRPCAVGNISSQASGAARPGAGLTVDPRWQFLTLHHHEPSLGHGRVDHRHASMFRTPGLHGPERTAGVGAQTAPASANGTLPREPIVNLSRRNAILNMAIRTTALAISVAVVLTPIALAIGIPVGSLFIIQGIAVLIGAMLGVYCCQGPEKFAAMMNKLMAKQSTEMQCIAGASVGLNAASSYNATWRGEAIATFVGYKSVKLTAKHNRVTAGMAGANAAGVAIGTVDFLANRQASEAMQVGAAIGGAVGGWVLGSVTGSTRVGEVAGAGALYGANWGRKVDEYATATIKASWLAFLTLMQDSQAMAKATRYIAKTRNDDPIPGKGEWTMAIAGGVTGGVYQAVDTHAGGEITRFTLAAGTARDTVSLGKLVKAARNLMNECFNTHPSLGGPGFPCID